MNIPDGFASVTPYFFVDNASAFIRFLVAGLGGVRDPHGNLWWISQRLKPGPYGA